MNRSRLKIVADSCVLFIIMFLLVGILGVFFMRIRKNKPIILGFSAQLTGKQAELGVQERNGTLLAIEEINASGGIAGRKISLIIHDDKGITKEAQAGDRELIKKGAIAIIGHATTAQTLAGLQVTNPANVVMISSTVSTPELSGIDDYFFRVQQSFKSSSENFAEYVYKNRGITNVSIIYDSDNTEYAKKYSEIFCNKFKFLGGSIIEEVRFSSTLEPDFAPIISKLSDSKAEGLLIIASDIDTALIAQRARIMGWQVPMFTSSWAQTETLINDGGQAVEGMIIEQPYNLTNNSQESVSFRTRYKERFGNEPSFGSAYSYEATLVLAEALKKTNGNKEGLKEALLKTNNFRGVMDTFSLDMFGDAHRTWHLSTISDGDFIMIDNETLTDLGGE